MKDAQGHGSNPRGGSSDPALDKAITGFQAAHQAGVNQALPSQSGEDLYNAAMAAAQHDHPNQSDYDAKTIEDMKPDFDELGDYNQYSVISGKLLHNVGG